MSYSYHEGKSSDAHKPPQDKSSDSATVPTVPSVPVDDTPIALLEQLTYVDNFLQPNGNDPISESPSFEEQLKAELAAFADDEFIFPDEENTKKRPRDDGSSGNGNDGWQFVDPSVSSGSPLGGENAHFSSSGPSNSAFNLSGNIADLLGSSSSAQPQQDFQQGSSALTQQSISNAQSLLSSLGATSTSISQFQQLAQTVQIPQGAQNTLAAAGLSQTQIEALATLIACHKDGLMKQVQQTQQHVQVPSQQQQIQAQLAQVLSQVTKVGSSGNNGSSGSFHGFSSAASPLSQHAEFLAHSLLNSHSQTVLDNSASSTNDGSLSTSNLPPGIAANFAATAQTFPLGASSATSLSTPSSTTGSTVGSTSSPGMRTGDNSSTTTPTTNSTHGEKDKRKRNTAASARFRVKKKMREQEMERSLKELSESSKNLELKVQQLQMENKLLRNLVIEKNHQRDADEVEQLKKKAKLSVAHDSPRQSGKFGGARVFIDGN